MFSVQRWPAPSKPADNLIIIEGEQYLHMAPYASLLSSYVPLDDQVSSTRCLFRSRRRAGAELQKWITLEPIYTPRWASRAVLGSHSCPKTLLASFPLRIDSQTRELLENG